MDTQTLEFHKIKEWHDMGYLGEGINVLEMETASSEHGLDVVQTFSSVAPKANVMLGNINYTIIDNELSDITINDMLFDEFVATNKIDIIMNSQSNRVIGGGMDSKVEDYLSSFENIIYIGSAGNAGIDGVTGKFENIGIMIGAAFVHNDGSIRREKYSGVEDTIDFACLHGYLEGTSFASPVFGGMVALIESRYGKILQSEIVNIFRDLTAGQYNSELGWGVPVLTKNIERLEVDMNIRLQINNNVAHVDGKKVLLDTPPVIKNGRTLVPLRFIAENLGCKVDWIADSKEIIIKKL